MSKSASLPLQTHTNTHQCCWDKSQTWTQHQHECSIQLKHIHSLPTSNISLLCLTNTFSPLIRLMKLGWRNTDSFSLVCLCVTAVKHSSSNTHISHSLSVCQETLRHIYIWFNTIQIKNKTRGMRLSYTANIYHTQWLYSLCRQIQITGLIWIDYNEKRLNLYIF